MSKEITITLPCYGIIVELTGDGGGSITSDLHCHDGEENEDEYNAAIDGVESIIMAHACAGIDIETSAYIEGIETAADAIGSCFS